MKKQSFDSISRRLQKALGSPNYHTYNRGLLINADCLDALQHIPGNSLDSCVTDGPYGIGVLGKEGDNFSPTAIRRATRECQEGESHHLQSERSPSMFAGNYDTSRTGAVRFQEFTYDWAVEVLRVLKPGAMLLSFCSPRMYHRMATGIEDAGFEIRDQIQYLYGTGFPKSHDISMAIDKLYKVERTVVGENPNRKGRKNWDTQPKNITLPASNEAKYWDGWGTGLKPSNEPIVLARKPIGEASVARNILKYGTGAINIDASRIAEGGGTVAIGISKDANASGKAHMALLKKGRFPANTIIDSEVARLLGDKARFFYSPKASKTERNAGCEKLQGRCQCPPGVREADNTVKKTKNSHPTVKNLALMEYLVRLVTPKNGICLDVFTGSGTTGIACCNLGFGFVGIERESEYFGIAKARIDHWQNVKKVA